MNGGLAGKKIIVGVTGGIAAYKSAYLVRTLIKKGAEVRVVMTPSAVEFIAPLTFSTLSGNEVSVNIFPQDQSNGTSLKTWHIETAMWGELMIIAPATVNTIAKIARGFADNALTTIVAALRCPLIIAPAADEDMFKNPIAQKNIQALEKDLNAYTVFPEKGFLASGLSGEGRMAEPEKIIEAAELILSGYKKDLSGKKFLITAGPTYEDIDPVRYIGNRSSGKMGYALAKAAFLRGAEVELISGPSAEKIYPEIPLCCVRSSTQMKENVEKRLPDNDILIMSAAVADYKPEKYFNNKVKKEDELKEIKLLQTDDILASVSKKGKFIVGFALETENGRENALAKMKKKNINMIIMNSAGNENSAFESDFNKVDIFCSDGSHFAEPQASKFIIANKILDKILLKL